MSAADPVRLAELTVPADPDQLVICRLALSGAAGHLGVSEGALEDMKLVLSEACSNAIQHGYGDREAGVIDVSFRVVGDELEIEVTDHGRGFVPDGPRGVGMMLLGELCSRWSAGPAVDGNSGATVVFARRIEP